MSNKTYQQQHSGPGPPPAPAFASGAGQPAFSSPQPALMARNYGPTAAPSPLAAGAGMDQGKLTQVTGYPVGLRLGGPQQQQQQQQQQRDDLRVDRSGLGGVAAGAATFVPPPGFQGGYYPYPGFAPMYPHPATMDQKSAAGVSLDPERVAAINRALALAQVKPVSGPAPGGAGAAVGSSLGQLHQLTSGAAAGPIDSASWASLHPRRAAAAAAAGGGGWAAPQLTSAATAAAAVTSPSSTPSPPLPASLAEPSGASPEATTKAATATATSKRRQPAPSAHPYQPDKTQKSTGGDADADGGGDEKAKRPPSSAAAAVDDDGDAEDAADAADAGSSADFELDSAGKRRRLTAEERLQRSRERNQLHARKTRQRKKAQLQLLMTRSAELQAEQKRLRQAITDRRTASILLDMSGGTDDSKSGGAGAGTGPGSKKVGSKASRDHPPALADMPGGTPRPRAGMLRGSAESDDTGDGSSKGGSGGNGSDDLGSESTAGTSCSVSSSGRTSSEANSSDGANGGGKGGGGGGKADDKQQRRQQQQQQPRVGNPGDAERLLELSQKTRSECTPEELEQIRRERNRMHAKRTRDRKKLHLEATEGMISRLEQENRMLRASMKASVGGGGSSSGSGRSGGGDGVERSSRSGAGKAVDAGASAAEANPPQLAVAHVPGFSQQCAPQQSATPPPPMHGQQQQQQQQQPSIAPPHLGVGHVQHGHPPPHPVPQFANHPFLHAPPAHHLPQHLHGHVYPSHQQFMHPGHSQQPLGYYAHPFEHSGGGGGGWSGGEGNGSGGAGGGVVQEGNPFLQGGPHGGPAGMMGHPNPHYLLHYQGWPPAAYGPPPVQSGVMARTSPPLMSPSRDPQQHAYPLPEQKPSTAYKSWDAPPQGGAGTTSFVPWANASFMSPEARLRQHQQHQQHQQLQQHRPGSSLPSSSARKAEKGAGAAKVASSSSNGDSSGGGSGGVGSRSSGSGRNGDNDNDNDNDDSATTDNSCGSSPSRAGAAHQKRSAAEREQAIEENQQRLDRDLSRGCHEAWQKVRRERRSAKRKRSAGGGGGEGESGGSGGGGQRHERGGSGSGGSGGEGSECSSSASSWMESSESSSSVMPGSTTSGDTGRGRDCSRSSSGSEDSSIRRSGSPSSSSSGGEDPGRSLGMKRGRRDKGDGNNGDVVSAGNLERRSFAAESP